MKIKLPNYYLKKFPTHESYFEQLSKFYIHVDWQSYEMQLFNILEDYSFQTLLFCITLRRVDNFQYTLRWHTFYQMYGHKWRGKESTLFTFNSIFLVMEGKEFQYLQLIFYRLFLFFV